MKRFVAASTLALGIGAATPAFANVLGEIRSSTNTGSYGAAGCGLGSIVFGNKPGLFQILAATTNPIFHSQTFGITTGTSNCDGALLSSVEDKEDFIANNYSTLSKEAAQGGGEAVLALSRSFGCHPSVLPVFVAELKENHNSVFADQTPSQVVQGVSTMVQKDLLLAESCVNT